MARIYCPINSTWLPGAYSASFGRHQVFRDNPVAGTTHFFRGMKKEEIPDLLRPAYSIGPHDTNYSICGRFNEEVFGWWFDEKLHDRAHDSDDVFWEIGHDLTPDHLDLRSKTKLIGRFGLDPDTNWKPYLGGEWNTAYELYHGKGFARELIDAENLLLEIRNTYRDEIPCKAGHFTTYPMINAYNMVAMMDHIDAQHVTTGADFFKQLFLDQGFIEHISDISKVLLNSTRARYSASSYISFLVSDLMMTAFLPLSKGTERAAYNYSNLYLAHKLIADTPAKDFDMPGAEGFGPQVLSGYLRAWYGEPVDIEHRVMEAFEP